MIKTTTNYKQFSLSEQNRDVDLGNRKAKNLAESMLEYGWLDAFPLMAKKQGNRLLVIDGQHRLSIAMEYGIPVKYVTEKMNIDVAKLNDTAHSWTVDDFAKKFAKSGDSDYQELIEFSQRYGISISMSSAILAGTAHAGNVVVRLKSGAWRITNREQAYELAECYREICECNKVFAKLNALKVLWACFHVNYFDPSRLVASIQQRPHHAKSVTKLELFYEVFEELYNFARREKRPLKFDAEQAMKARIPSSMTNKRGA